LRTVIGQSAIVGKQDCGMSLEQRWTRQYFPVMSFTRTLPVSIQSDFGLE